MKNAIAFLYFFAFVFLLFCCLSYRELVFSGIVTGINYCLNTLIPSLFPMIFLSCAINNSPALNIFSFLTAPFCKYLFKVPACCGCAILFGMCFGYPVGAKLISTLLKNNLITSKEANRLMLFCVNAGIPFTVIFVGGIVLNNIKLGLYIFICTTISSILIGIFTSIKKKSINTKLKFLPTTNFNDIICTSASQSLSSTISMCLYVVIFSGFCPILIKFSFIKNADLSSAFWMILEVTNGIFNSVSNSASIYIFVIGIAFGGFCVHMQVFSFFPKHIINFKTFYIYKVLNVGISVFLFKISTHFFAVEQSVNLSINNFTVKGTTGTATASVCLILLACTYIYLNKNIEKT